MRFKLFKYSYEILLQKKIHFFTLEILPRKCYFRHNNLAYSIKCCFKTLFVIVILYLVH
uniref:Uncharacterized protein n=1 Tax=Heterorhabditis bacteriophora TaxID=37862 RepID=A0A1I7WIB7_HETBA